MRILVRSLLACALLFGGLGWSWTPVPVQAAEPHECCCGMVPGPHHDCPCPKPETPSQNGCGSRTQGATAPLVWLQRAAQGETRREAPRPLPAAGQRVAGLAADAPSMPISGWGRDPDLGRHLARLRLLRI